MIKPELLAPAGNLKKLKLAFYYGADAVYLGAKSFSLRSYADNFTEEELQEGIKYAHARGRLCRQIAEPFLVANFATNCLVGYIHYKHLIYNRLHHIPLLCNLECTSVASGVHSKLK